MGLHPLTTPPSLSRGVGGLLKREVGSSSVQVNADVQLGWLTLGLHNPGKVWDLVVVGSHTWEF